LGAALPHARRVADPFHAARLANSASGEVRRRAHNQTPGHRGHKTDPLHRARELLLSAHETISAAAEAKLLGLLDAGDPHSEARDARRR